MVLPGRGAATDTGLVSWPVPAHCERPHEQEEGPPGPSATPETAIDWARFGLLRGACTEAEGPTSLAGLVVVFLEQSARRLDQLRAALAAGDAPTLALVAHGMKGSSGTFGAMTACALAEALEEASQCGVLDEAARLLPHLETELGLVRAALARDVAPEGTRT